MKTEITIYTLVLIISLTIPIFSYVSIGDKLSEQALIHSEFAKELKNKANKIETGKINIYIENIPNAFRHNAKAEIGLSEMFTNYDSAKKNFFKAALWATFTQAMLLIGLYAYRRRNVK